MYSLDIKYCENKPKNIKYPAKNFSDIKNILFKSASQTDLKSK